MFGSVSGREGAVQLDTQLEAMIDTPRRATGRLAAKWKALLFMAGVLFLFPLALVPANWLSARGLLLIPKPQPVVLFFTS